MAKPKQRAALPTKDEVLEFIRTSPIKVGKREIARAFGIKGADKIGLKGLLKDIEREGQVVRERNESGRGRTRRFAPPDAIPKTTMIEIIGLDIDEGEALARPLDWTGPDAPAELRVHAERRAGAALSIGMRALARIERAPDGRYTAHILRAIEGAPDRVLGVYAPDAEGGRLQPTDRKIKTEFAVALSDNGGAKPGQLVLAEALPSRRLGLPRARVIEVLGSMASPKAASLIAIHAQGIPTVFDDAALAESTRARPAPMGQREDLRQVPLVTIDGEDARDFDDAVFAEPDDDPKNPGGFHLIVAIADVAWYVRPASALDRTARARGNSVYFPDRVVPMLPEKLSNDLCSLRPDEDRPTLAVHIWIDAAGRKRRHRFTRAMIRSAARLTYDQAQNGIDDQPNGAPKELLKPVIEPLYAAFRALSKARRQRGTLDLDLEERKVVLGPDGRIEKIVPRPRYDSHRLIEEFMILANVCAAESLEDRRLPCMYRVHEDPSPEKLESLREVLDGLGYRLAKGQVLKPAQFNRILEWATDTPFRHLVNDMVLRSQSLAVYSPDNKGHFGLALVRYAHFTSP
ncbi:MAG: RNB domain-containing ribonuclease, partial [Rhodospirillales bacterium]|nr:RNB domain-containing ribonuclease [Rhodospirillales bacterium]